MTRVRPVVLLGAPRSGTTWLQNLLGADPRVVTPQETDLFTRYVQPLDESWRWSRRGGVDDWRGRRFKGLPAVLTEAQFHALVGGFVADVIDAVHARKPDAEVLVEKSPSHSLIPELIVEHLPAVRFVHIIRDGRDAAASAVAASHGWGAFWAPRSVGAAARLWREHVEAAHRARSLAPYLELRYEALRGEEGATCLRDVFAFCDLDVELAESERRLRSSREAGGAATSIVFGGEAVRHDDVGREPDGFAGTGEPGGWAAWSVDERVTFAREAGALLAALGYAPDEGWLGTRSRVARARRRDARRRRGARVVRAAGNRLVRWSGSIDHEAR